MEVHKSKALPGIRKPVVTIGIFDGVHRGHRYILDALKERAAASGGESVVVTLWPHPRLVLDKDVWNFSLLHSLNEKVGHFGRLGIDHLVIVPFSREVASLSACRFVEEYLASNMSLSRLLIGYDNKFGKDRRGDASALAACAEAYGFTIEKLKEFVSEYGIISSTSIRNALAEGDLERARVMLDYDYYLSGRVVSGNQVGRTIGYPTANIHPFDPYKMIPMDGVYAVHLEHRETMYPGMLNIGHRPTLDSASVVKTIEVYLFDVDLDLYDADITVHFRERVRDEKKFANIGELKQQLQRDERTIRNILG